MPLICHVNLSSGYRGGERQTELLIAGLQNAGYRQRLVAQQGGQLAARTADWQDVEVRAVAGNPLTAARAAGNASLLHAHEARAVYTGWLLQRLRGTPYLLTRRVDNPFKDSWLRDRAYERAHTVVTVSRAIARQVDARYGAGRSTIIADAHSSLTSDNASALRGRYASKTVIGHVGALDHSHKGQETLIDVARRAATEHPDWQFVFVGDGRDEVSLKAKAEGLDNVEFTGFVDNVGDWLAAFDVFAFPSLHEGLGSILLDAMYFGLPVVASRVGGIPDVVQDGQNGLLVPPDDPGTLFSALRTLLRDSRTLEAMRTANLQHAKRYAPACMADAYAAIYSSILA